ncbi:MAG: DinB family protein [Saprospiraceae bacterium]
MTLDALLKDYAAYNLWANTAYINWLRTKPADLMTREVPSSFPTIKDTLLHIWSAEQVWLERLQGISPTKFVSIGFTGTTEDVFAGILQTSAAFEAHIRDQIEAFFQETCPFRLLNGTEDARPRHQMILHCMQHSTFHRGQVVTIARNLGITDPPQTDYIKYVRLMNEA